MLTLATDADLPETVKLINASYRGETSRQGWANEADYIEGERTTLDALCADLQANPAAKLYLKRNPADGVLLGCVWLEPHDREVWYLGLLTVRPDIQDQKLGRTILTDAEAVVRREGGLTVRMTVVHLRETLIAWYQRRGYVLTGETAPFPPADPPRDDLHFVVLQRQL
jgi:GNAT superfamily N-acetyltransferase